MNQPVYRLGDLIDDYCPRCRLPLNHAVASMVQTEVAKVICQTCYTEHPFRHGEGATKKKPASGKTTLFDEVLARTSAPAAPSELAAAAPPSDAAENTKKKPAGDPARYITRHKTRPPRKKK